MLFKKIFFKFIQDESGATAIEYSLFAALIGISIVGSLQSTSSKIKNTLLNVQNRL